MCSEYDEEDIEWCYAVSNNNSMNGVRVGARAAESKDSWDNVNDDAKEASDVSESNVHAE